MSKDILYNYTREAFKDLNIHIDKYGRTNNLFYRFRHGFCMYLLYVEKIPPLQICKLARCNDTKGLDVYDSPTEEMIADLKNNSGQENYKFNI